METLHSTDAALTVDHEQGGRLASLVVGGHELLVSRADGLPGPTGWGCFPMIPWAGRIRRGALPTPTGTHQLPINLAPHAIHGTTFVRPWTRTGAGTLTRRIGDDWPWSGTATQELRLEEGSLTATIAVEADAGQDPMPVTVGWHPWFHRRIGGVDARIHLDAAHMWRRDDDGIPDGTLVPPPPGPWDDCFTAIAWPVVVEWPGVVRLEIRSDCAHVVVYDEQPRAVCVEPQSGPPDAHRTGTDLVLVTPDDPLVRRTTWTWSVADPSA